MAYDHTHDECRLARLSSTVFFLTTMLFLVALILESWPSKPETKQYHELCKLAAKPSTTPQDKGRLYIIVLPKDNPKPCILKP